MKTIMICILLATITFSIAETHIPAGDVSGIWSYENSPYIIDGEISIQINNTLAIEPGIEVIFSGHYKFNIYGRILAEGTENEMIFFSAQNTEIGWHSLRFWNTNLNGQDSSRVVYCELRLGKAYGEGNERQGGAIYCNNSSDILISDCLITKNYAKSHGGGIHCSSSSPCLINVTITGNYVFGEYNINTYGGGISCSNSDPYLENVTISNNISHYSNHGYGGGIYCSDSNPILENVTISGNTAEGYNAFGAGIYLTNSNPNLLDVTINGNNCDSSHGIGGGIYCNNNSGPSLENVVINGNYANYGGGIYCSDSNPTLENVTITGNHGYDYGGGIYCGGSSPILENVTISGNTAHYYGGGGIYLIYNSNPILTNVTISGNNAAPYNSKGGGIYCSGSYPSLTNVTIVGNTSQYYGGGIFCSDNSNLNMENVSITNNSASNHGGGIYCSESNLSFNLENRCNIYSNNITNNRGYGLDLFAYACDLINVIVDTFTVLTPTDYYASPITNLTFDIQHGIIEQVNADLYVSPDGDDTNSGLSADEPLRTIRYALTSIFADSLNQHTIYLSPGIYSPSTNGDQFPLPMSNYVSLQGNNQEDTFLDADSLSGILRFDFVTESNIRDITLRNSTNGIYLSNSCPSLENVTISDNSGSGICCSDNSNPSLVNVAITGNSGLGIGCVDNSNPSLVNVIITGNSGSWGGGINCYNHSNPSLENVSITGNSASLFGGGICCVNNCNPSLMNVTITGNSASKGGGIYCSNNCDTNFENVTIMENSASQHGGGIYCSESNMSFNIENRCSIYLNNVLNSRGYGLDIFTYKCDTINVFVDTFTVLTPTDYYASPINYLTFDIIYGTQNNLINSDFYVSVDGDDSNMGTTADEPLKTIRCALSKIYADSLNQNTIFLSPGIYSTETTGEIFPIEWSNFVSLAGSEEEETILDGYNETGVLKFHYVTAASIENITIRNGDGEVGCGIYFNHSSPSIKKVTVTGCSGHAIYCKNSSNPSLKNVLITDNAGKGFYCKYSSNPTLENVTITGNYDSFCGGIYCYDSNPCIVNCIFWNDSLHEIHLYYQCSITISYSDIQGDFDGIVSSYNSTVNWLEGNIDEDPLFAEPQSGDFHLTWANFPIPDSTMSPCIDAGDPNLPYDPDGTISDMGAFYYEQPVGIEKENVQSSVLNVKLSNYPNPFNPTTTIEFSIQNDSNIELSIYNIKGQKIKTLVQNEFTKGSHSVIWYGNNESGDSASSGVYLYKLKVNDKIKAVKKCLLLK